jgi:uncharacterized membrane protein YgcG
MTNKVTVINMQGIPVDLVPLPSNTWSLQGLLPGVYTLNVNVAMSSSGILGTYETILVILEPDQQPLPPTTIINQITIPCPGNSTLVDGKCTKPTPNPCPPGTTGVPPNCEPICPAGEDCPCPEGTTGTPPNCIPIEECPEGTTGTPPNCIPIEECPEGTTGTPPNCIPEGGDGGNGGDGGIGGGGLFNGEGGGDGSGGDGSAEDGSAEDGSGGNGDVPSQFG